MSDQYGTFGFGCPTLPRIAPHGRVRIARHLKEWILGNYEHAIPSTECVDFLLRRTSILQQAKLPKLFLSAVPFDIQSEARKASW